MTDNEICYEAFYSHSRKFNVISIIRSGLFLGANFYFFTETINSNKSQIFIEHCKRFLHNY